MGILDDSTACAVLVAVAARERELSRNDYFIHRHPEDLGPREEQYLEKYGDLDDINVFARRLGTEKKDVAESVGKLMKAGIIAPDEATLQAYKPLADAGGKEVPDFIRCCVEREEHLPPRTYEVCVEALVRSLFAVARQHRPSSIKVKLDSEASRIVSAKYSPQPAKKAEDDAWSPVLSEIEGHSIRVNGLVGFWMNFMAVDLISDYTKTKKPRFYTLRELLLHLLVELKELSLDLTLLDDGDRIARPDRDYTRMDYQLSAKADEELEKALRDEGFNALLRLSDKMMDFGQAKMLRETILDSHRRPLQDALLWDMGFHVRKETVTRVYVEDSETAQKRMDSMMEEFKSKGKNHYKYISPENRQMAWRYYELIHKADYLPQEAWERLERHLQGENHAKAYDYRDEKAKEG